MPESSLKTIENNANELAVCLNKLLEKYEEYFFKAYDLNKYSQNKDFSLIQGKRIANRAIYPLWQLHIASPANQKPYLGTYLTIPACGVGYSTYASNSPKIGLNTWIAENPLLTLLKDLNLYCGTLSTEAEMKNINRPRVIREGWIKENDAGKSIHTMLSLPIHVPINTEATVNLKDDVTRILKAIEAQEKRNHATEMKELHEVKAYLNGEGAKLRWSPQAMRKLVQFANSYYQQHKSVGQHILDFFEARALQYSLGLSQLQSSITYKKGDSAFYGKIIQDDDFDSMLKNILEMACSSKQVDQAFTILNRLVLEYLTQDQTNIITQFIWSKYIEFPEKINERPALIYMFISSSQELQNLLQAVVSEVKELVTPRVLMDVFLKLNEIYQNLGYAENPKDMKNALRGVARNLFKEYALELVQQKDQLEEQLEEQSKVVEKKRCFYSIQALLINQPVKQLVKPVDCSELELQGAFYFKEGKITQADNPFEMLGSDFYHPI